MMDTLLGLKQYLVSREILITVLLFGAVVLLHALLTRLISRRQQFPIGARRRWIVNSRNTLVVVLVLGLLLIWAPQLQTFAVTLIAVAVALVFATKELLSCLSGSVFRLGVAPFALGDRIEIGGVRGNVVDHTWLATKVLEIGPGQTSQEYTGRAMIFPNSLLLSMPLTNETYTKKFVLHVTRIPLTTMDNLAAAEELLLASAWQYCRPYLEEAKKYMKNLEGRHWLDAPSVQPRVTYQFVNAGLVNLLVRVPCRPYETANVEQAILGHFLKTFRFAASVASSVENTWEAPLGPDSTKPYASESRGAG